MWISIRKELPRMWAWVRVKCHPHDLEEYPAYRTIFGRWRFKSGFKCKIQSHNAWLPHYDYKKHR